MRGTLTYLMTWLAIVTVFVVPTPTSATTWDAVYDFTIPTDHVGWLKLDTKILPAGTTVRFESCSGWGTFDDDKKGRPCDNEPVDPHRCEGGLVVRHSGLPVARGDYRVCDTDYPGRSIFAHYLMNSWGNEFTVQDSGYLHIKIHDRPGKYRDNRGAYTGQVLVKFPEE